MRVPEFRFSTIVGQDRSSNRHFSRCKNTAVHRGCETRSRYHFADNLETGVRAHPIPRVYYMIQICSRSKTSSTSYPANEFTHVNCHVRYKVGLRLLNDVSHVPRHVTIPHTEQNQEHKLSHKPI